MTSGRAMIGISAVVTAGTLSIAEVQRNDQLPTMRQWTALAAAYLTLSIAADLGAEGFGGGLALLLMVSTVLVRGDDLLAFLGVKLGDPVKQRRRFKGEVRRFNAERQAGILPQLIPIPPS